MTPSRARWMPYWVLVIGLSMTAMVTFAVDRVLRQREEARFENAVQSTYDRIEARLDAYVAMLLGTRAFVAAQPELTLREFQTYVANLEPARLYPGIQGIGYTVRVPKGEVAEFETQLREQGHEDFVVWPKTPARDEIHSIVFLEPLDARNKAAIGYDMYSEPVRRAAMARARDTASLAATARVTLVQEIDEHKQPGFLLYLPFYGGREAPPDVAGRREALIGFIYSPFRVGDLLHGIFGSEDHPRVALEIYDGTTTDADARIYREDASPSGKEPWFVATKALDVAGTPWTLRFESEPHFEQASGRDFLPYFVFVGVFASGLLFAVTRSQVVARTRAEAAEAERTASLLRVKQARAAADAARSNLEQLFTQAPAAIAIIRGPDYTYELSNPLNNALAGGRQLEGQRVRDALPELQGQGLGELLDHVYQTGEPYVGTEFPLTVPTADGGKRDIFINGTYQPLRSGDGTIEGVMAFAYEVTELVLARKKVEQSEQNFRFLAEAVPQLVWTTLPSGAIDYCNDNCLEYTGIDLLTKQQGGWVSAIHPDDVERVSQKWEHAVRSGGPFEEVYRLRRAEDGQYRWFIGRASPRVDASGTIVKWFGTATDIDDQKRNEESLQMQARVLQNMGEGVSLSNEQGIIIFTNPSENEMFGYAPGELLGQHVTVQNAYPPDQNERVVNEVIEELKSHGCWSGEWANIRKDGATFTTFARITTLEVGRERYFLCVRRDITEQVRVREEREQLLGELQQAVRTRDDFLSIAGHELKTPLAALTLQIQGLERQAEKGAFGTLPPRLLERLAKTNVHVARLDALVNQLLDVSRITLGRLVLQPETVDLTALVFDVVERFAEPLHRSGSTISVDAPDSVSGSWDRLRLDQVITNLISNAIKYGAGKPIAVSVTASREGAGLARLTVRDQGIGIDAAHAGRIFGRFERAVSERNYGGLGLGLWISRQIVEAHDGKIEFSSIAGAGATFTVELPTHVTREVEP